jgi:hypothetical protein
VSLSWSAAPTADGWSGQPLPKAPPGMRAVKCPRCNTVQNIPETRPEYECWQCKAAHRLWETAPQSTPRAPAPQKSTTVSLRSLARFMDAPLADVEKYSESGELRRFFTRSDSQLGGPEYRSARRAMSGRQALLETLAMALDPITGKPYGKPRTRSGKQALTETMGMRWPPEHRKPKTLRKIKTETAGMRWPREYKRLTWRQAKTELEGLREPGYDE